MLLPAGERRLRSAVPQPAAARVADGGHHLGGPPGARHRAALAAGGRPVLLPGAPWSTSNFQ